ncbi:restriction endonuclease [Candidatus Micrarchaeota archaeon]|nr:restriction endonuclease [Candidatus Micrarchaeota archaeon]
MVLVKKRSGKLEPFDESKIVHALERAGATKTMSKKVLSQVREQLYDGIPTKKIFRIVFSLLSKEKASVASKFNLKSAIALLGPKGHNFETFIAHILNEKGYDTQVRQVLQGACISHEVDVVASKGSKTYMVEAKFHNKPWIYSPIQDALYTYARFLDVERTSSHGKKFTNPMLATNTRFSSDVIKYSKCNEMELLGWRYPVNAGIEHIVDKTSMYPITVLQKLDRPSLEKLMDMQIVIISDILEIKEEHLMKITGKPKKTIDAVREEVESILKGG